jgi:1,4-dihydroxy-2-naphthoate octaprenyltransferase
MSGVQEQHVQNTRLGVWIAAIRPATLWAGVVPVMVGAAMAKAAGIEPGWPSLAALFGAIQIQIGTNLVNDYADFKTGADGPDRLGPKRAAAQGWLTPRSILMGACVSLVSAGLVGIYLTWVGGLPILILGLISIACAVGYTAGPWPLAYVGLGDVFVFIFFGLGAVCGTFYLETGTLNGAAILGGSAIGALSTAILVVNNLRDRNTDSRVGKKTLAVRFGERFTRLEYVLLIGLAYGSVLLAVAFGNSSTWSLLVLITLPMAAMEVRGIFTKDGADLNAHLSGTARLELMFGVCLAAGVML